MSRREHITQDKDYIKISCLVKTIEFVIIAAIGASLFSVLMLNESLREALFGNRFLFIISAAAWGTVLVAFIFILADFILIRNSAVDTARLSKAAYSDALTGLPNRHSIDLMMKLQSPEALSKVGCALIKLSNLMYINNEYGHEIGDILIRDFCQILITVGGRYGFVGRNGGNDFLSFFEDCSDNTIKSFITELGEQISSYNEAHLSTPIEIKYSYAVNSIEKCDGINDLLTIVYRRIEDKAQHA